MKNKAPNWPVNEIRQPSTGWPFGPADIGLD